MEISKLFQKLTETTKLGHNLGGLLWVLPNFQEGKLYNLALTAMASNGTFPRTTIDPPNLNHVGHLSV